MRSITLKFDSEEEADQVFDRAKIEFPESTCIKQNKTSVIQITIPEKQRFRTAIEKLTQVVRMCSIS